MRFTGGCSAVHLASEVYPGYLLVNGRTTLKRKKAQGQNSRFLSGSQPDRHWSGRECARLPADHAKCLPLSDMPAPSTRRLGCKDGSMHVRHVGGDGPSLERFASRRRNAVAVLERVLVAMGTRL